MTTFAFEPSGKLKYPSESALLEADKDSAVVTFTRFMLADGRPYYAYIAVKPSKFQEFHALTAAGKALTPSYYGEVLADGFAAEPPPDVAQDMRQRFGCDEKYQEKLLQETRQQQAAFVKQKEASRIMDAVAMLKHKQSGSVN